MGSVKKILSKTKLLEREKHHSRMFVDLAENIHIHHREFRTVFSLNEYFEYVDILNNSTNDVKNYLEQNKDYKENKYPTTLMIAGGNKRQLKYLENSPQPNKSKYFSNDFSIELQDEFVTDEIHIHYRDFRIALDRLRFKEIAVSFAIALKNLNNFENKSTYKRKSHSDRIITDYNKNESDKSFSYQQGVIKLKLDKIKSYHFKNIMSEFFPDMGFIKTLKKQIRNDNYPPLILSTENNNDNYIIDGHHRYYAAMKSNVKYINCIVTDMSFEESVLLREAEDKLKLFDIKTNYKYGFSNFYQSYFGYKTNKFYRNHFKDSLKYMTIFYRIIRKLKRIFFSKENVFKSFYEKN